MNDLIEIKKELQVIKELLANNSKKVLNLNELADYIGFSKSYVYKLTSQNLIPHSKPNGKAVFFDRDEIDKWLLNNSTITHQQSRSKET
jgi:excisionase family DNA binding protein